MSKIIYPTDYSDTDKAIYDDLISRGEALIGKKINKKDSFLLDLSAKITINQMKGVSNNFSDEEIEELKSRHKEMSQQGMITTPPDIFYKMINHPLSTPAEEYYEKYNKEPIKEEETTEVTKVTEVTEEEIVDKQMFALE